MRNGRRIILPKTKADLTDPERAGDLLRSIRLLNAVQRLKLVVASGGEESVSAIDISGRSAILTGTAHLGITYESETLRWISAVEAYGGTFTDESKTIANNLIIGLRAAGVINRIIYFLPFLGGNFAAALVPLIDRLAVGPAANTNFGSSDFSEATGLQGDGSSKLLDSRIRPSQLGISDSGGMGWWELSANFTGSTNSVMGTVYNPGGGTNAFTLGRTAGSRYIEWNKDVPSAPASDAVAGTNGNLYGQRSSASMLELYFSGSIIASSTVAYIATAAAYDTIRLFGAATNNVVPGPRYANTRAGCAYLTDGTLSASEISNLHTVLETKLITPTRRA